MNKKIFLFDMDRTIFDTETLGKNFKQSLVDVTQKSIEEIEKINKTYKLGLESSTDFDPDKFLKKVEKETKVDLETLNQAFFSSKNFVLYPETKEKLNKLLNEGYSLGIFSEGVYEWQMKKLILTGIIDFFDKNFIFIGRRKQNDDFIKKLPDGAIIVDDKKEVVEKLKNLNRFKVIWINRINDEKIQGVKTIKSLLEIIEEKDDSDDGSGEQDY